MSDAYEQLLQLVKTRRTTRAMKNDPVPDELVDKMLELARWAPTGFNLQPAELMVLKDKASKAAVKKIIDEWIESDFYDLEATRESWQGPPWTLESRGRVACPLAPVYILIMGDTRRMAGLPMNARFEKPKGESIFETSLADVFMYLWLGAHSLGLGAQPVSAVKNARVQGLVKDLLNLPDFIYVYELLAVGYAAKEGPPAAKLMRHLDEMVHTGRLRDGELLAEEELRKQIRKLRMGNVARHQEAKDAGGAAER
jgi:5,6-dimethylbenzimidazole synthase